MTNKPYIVRYRLTHTAPTGEDYIVWKEIVNRKDIHHNPSMELIQEFTSKAQAVIFANTLNNNIATGWLLYKLQLDSDKHSY